MKPRSFLPREHGAYGQLALPLVAALAMGHPSVAAGLLAVAAIGAFVGHEPLLVLLGQRGSRARREDGRRALVLCAGLSAGALVAAGIAVALAPGVLRALALAAGLGALALAVVVLGREKTLLGEGIAASALAAAAMPVAEASGVAHAQALGAWAAWSLGFAAVTCAVRAVASGCKDRPAAWRLAPVVALAGVAGALAALVPSPGVAALPLVDVAVVIAARPPAPRRLPQVGWALMVTSATSAALMALPVATP